MYTGAAAEIRRLDMVGVVGSSPIAPTKFRSNPSRAKHFAGPFFHGFWVANWRPCREAFCQSVDGLTGTGKALSPKAEPTFYNVRQYALLGSALRGSIFL